MISVAESPPESETLYMIVYVPDVPVLTVPVLTILDVMFPSSVSDAVAPASVYESFFVIVITALPVSVILG